MTDLDHFAAAALAGLLAQGDDGSFSEESYASGAYRWADEMLRFRDSRNAKTTNHDAAPAAIAEDLGAGDSPATEPALNLTDAEREAVEQAVPKGKPAEVSFTLTDAERAALSWFTGGRGQVCPQYMATIRGLLERTK